MKILCVGGGSGGHVTPVVAIASEIKKLSPDSEIKFVTDKRFFEHSRKSFELLGVKVTKISAGKLRRYANLNFADHIKHIFKSYLPNIIDVFKFGWGTIQAFWLILHFKPDVVFIKGGYVGLPVGLATAKCFKRIPIVLHDSDARPGLTNRILSKYAEKIGVGMPLEFSEYDESKTEFVGIPIEKYFFETDIEKKRSKNPLVFVIGGSQGSRTINEQIVKIAPKFTNIAHFVLVTGDKNFINMQKLTESIDNLKVLPFISENEVCKYMKESEVVITRAGATTMAEIAAVKVPSIIIPSPYLASDHQTKNAEIFEKSKAALVVYEKDLSTNLLSEKLDLYLKNEKMREQFSQNIAKFSKPNATKRMAEIVIGVGNGEEEE